MSGFFGLARVRSLRSAVACALASTLLIATGASHALADPIDQAGDPMRTSYDSSQTKLTPSLVSQSTFGQQYATQLDGQIYMTPVVSGSTAFVATETNHAYGVNVSTGQITWNRSFGSPFQASTVSCGDLTPNIGSTANPAFDPATNTVYFTTKVADGADELHPHWYLQGVDINTGASRPGFPVTIQGTADNDPSVTFNPLFEHQRPGLLLVGGVVYIAFGAHCDYGKYQGWVMAVKVTGTPSIKSSWVNEIGNSGGGGIWQSGGGIVSDGLDASGNPHLYVSSGNGISPPVGSSKAKVPGTLAESVVRLDTDATGHLKATDFFSPANANVLDQNDTDLGSGGPIALPDSYGTAKHQHLMVQVGKDGRVFLLDRDDLGGRATGAGGTDRVIQTVGPTNGVWGHPAAYPGTASEGSYVYVVEADGPLRAYRRTVDSDGNPTLSPDAASNETFGYTSGSPLVTSANGAAGTGLVWVVYTPDATGLGAQLRAYDAVPVNGHLNLRWSAPLGQAAKFITPVAADGRILITGRDGMLRSFGSPANMSLTASPADFGSAVVGKRVTKSVTFTANSAVSISSVKITSKGTSPFTVGTTTPALPASLSAGQKLSVPVTFSPSTWGDRTAQVTVTLADGSTVAADLHGVGLQEGIGFSPNPVDFEQIVTGNYKTIAITIVNTGQQTQTIKSVGALSAPFSRISPAAGTTIAPQTSVSVPVTYRPAKASGGDKQTLTVVTNTGSYQLPLTGSAITGQGHLSITPRTVDFGNVVVGTPRTLSFDVSNTGNVPIKISLAKAPVGAFNAPVPLSEGLVLGPDDTITQQVTFTPRSTGAVSDIYQINGDDGQGVIRVALTGTGVSGHQLPAPGTSGAWQANGSASISSGSVLLTNTSTNQRGSAFSTSTIASEGFDARFQIAMGGGSGGEGQTFVLLPATASASTIGQGGGALGYGGIPGSVAVTFDSHQNGADPSANFVGVATGWQGSDTQKFVYAASSSNVPNLRIGNHQVDVNYYDGTLRVSIDGQLRIATPVTLPAQVRPGFTGTTSSITDNHAVSDVTITSPTEAPGPGVTIATPATNATVWGTTPVSAKVTAGVAPLTTTVSVDGKSVTSTTSASVSTSWNTTSVADGQHTITVTAKDSQGRTSTATRTVTVRNKLPIDKQISTRGTGKVTTGKINTSGADTIMAFVAMDGTSGTPQYSSVSGGGLTWHLVTRANGVTGATEIWSATTTGAKTGISVSAAPHTATHTSLVVVAIKGGKVGASSVKSAPNGAAYTYLTTTAAGSWMMAVGEDPNTAVARTTASNEPFIYQTTDATIKNSAWVQAAAPGAAKGARVQMRISGPVGTWNYAAVEITRS